MPKSSPSTEKEAPKKTRLSTEILRKKMEQLQNQLRDAEARDAKVERALDTRRKIILGGLLLEAASKNQWPRDLKQMLSWLTRENDKKAFEGWSPTGEPAVKVNDTEKVAPTPAALRVASSETSEV